MSINQNSQAANAFAKREAFVLPSCARPNHLGFVVRPRTTDYAMGAIPGAPAWSPPNC